MSISKTITQVLFLGFLTHIASAESGISLTQENTTQTIYGVEYTIEQKMTLAVDELIEITFKGRLIHGDIIAAAPNGPGGVSPVFLSFSNKVFIVTDKSLSGDISIRHGFTTDRSQIFNTNDRWPSEADSPELSELITRPPPVVEYTGVAGYASESWTNGNPNTIWYKDESVTKRHNRLYLFYIGETYAAWIQLGFVIQPNYSMLFSVEDHEIVPVENRQSMRLPAILQVDNTEPEMQIDVTVMGAMTVSGAADKQGTYIVQSSANLESWVNESSFNLNHPGSIEFSTSLPTENTYEVWEIPSEDTSHPNYDEESGVIWLDEPILESTPITQRFFKIVYQAPEE